ncbi:MAG: ComF family protein [Pseudomonadota bacterium]
MMWTPANRVLRKATQGVELVQPALAAAGRVLVPPTCLVCDEVTANDGGVCAKCWPEFHFLTAPICAVTGAPFAYDLGPDALSAEAIASPPDYDLARAAVLYNPPARRLVSRLKYSDDTALARWMAQWMMRPLQDAIPVDEAGSSTNILVMPVPLHRQRLAQRRYNQSAEIARALVAASPMDLIFDPESLVRHRPTPTQVGLGEKARIRNVSGAFRVPKDRRVEVSGRRVVLVDDVLTTGATVNACARALKRAGALEVVVITFARVPHGGFDAAL